MDRTILYHRLWRPKSTVEISSLVERVTKQEPGANGLCGLGKDRCFIQISIFFDSIDIFNQAFSSVIAGRHPTTRLSRPQLNAMCGLPTYRLLKRPHGPVSGRTLQVDRSGGVRTSQAAFERSRSAYHH